MGEPIEIKGVRDGLLVVMPTECEWSEAVARLLKRIDSQPAFFKGAGVFLKVGGRVVHRTEIHALQKQLAFRGVTLKAVLSESRLTSGAAKMLGLDTELGEPLQREPEELEPIPSEEIGSPGVLVRHTLRSGRTVRHEGHVVVIGDVNPGAEIIAGGDVVVWGRLRGVVHAGANGDEGAIVCALELAPTQLRIAGYIAVSPQDGPREFRPEMASIKNGRIVAEPWG